MILGVSCFLRDFIEWYDIDELIMWCDFWFYLEFDFGYCIVYL